MSLFKCIQMLSFLIIFRSFNFLSAEFNKVNHNLKSVKAHELPSEKDLSKYLKTIEGVNVFCSQNVNEIDINLAFGIFLANVNFKRVFKEKGSYLPSLIQIKLENIIVKNEELLNYFKKVTKDDINLGREYKQISKLFTNASIWVNSLENFVITHQKSYTLNELQKIYPQWDYYLEDVDNVKKWIPDPELSDICLESLSINPIDKKGFQAWCLIEDSCYKMLTEGDNFGYALCHRALLLIMARLGRGCTVLSPKKDKVLMGKYCSMGYAEAKYIAMHKYGIVDLMMEIICLCSLEGHAQFLRRNWLHQVLYFQKHRGCFGIEVTRPKTMTPFDGRKISFKTRYQNVSHEECNGHTTALALGIFSAAIRYIIQEYY